MGVPCSPQRRPSLASKLCAFAVILAVILVVSPVVSAAPAPMPLNTPHHNVPRVVASVAVSNPPAPQGTDTHLQKVSVIPPPS
ncbi:hypothetical protein BJ165DRAFT_1607806 [Panaeolus papilionaceus]|nr:hypothetical protein BJ165DRAFT_1607806 [Panaeolus papilionaceus]